jgi:hypothetical protein
VKTLSRYLELIVDPTFDEFYKKPDVRLAFLTSVAIFHSVDRIAEETGERRANLRRKWCGESLEFKLVDVIAHHFKHVRSSDEKIPATKPGLPIGRALGFNDAGDTLDVRNLYYVIRDAVRFVHKKAGTQHPRLP